MFFKKIAKVNRHPRLASAKIQQIASVLRVAEFLQRGAQYHQAGQRAQVLPPVLLVQPNHADALRLLGVLAHQGGSPDLAIGLIRLALRQNAQNATCHSNLAVVLREQGKVDEAVTECRKAVQLNARRCRRGQIRGIM